MGEGKTDKKKIKRRSKEKTETDEEMKDISEVPSEEVLTKSEKKGKKRKIKDKEEENEIDSDTENTLRENKEAKIEKVKKLKSELSKTDVKEKTKTKPDGEKEEAKKKRKMKRNAERKEVRKEEIVKRNEDEKKLARDLSSKYLQTWESDREMWKFNKRRQTWLLKYMYDTKQVSDSDFEILLSYMEGLKGSARAQTVKEAEVMINNSSGNQSNDNQGDSDAEDQKEAETEKAGLSPEKSERIRQVLQILT